MEQKLLMQKLSALHSKASLEATFIVAGATPIEKYLTNYAECCQQIEQLHNELMAINDNHIIQLSNRLS